MEEGRILLCKVPSIIERDALLTALDEAGIGASSPDRDMMINLAGEPNLALGGYSALFEGYSVFVPAAREADARSVLAVFRRRDMHLSRPDRDSEAGDPAALDPAGRRFLACAFFSVVVPVALNLASLYWFFRSRNVFRFRPGAALFALAIDALMIAGGVIALWRSIS